MEIGEFTYGIPQIKWKNPNSKFICGRFCSIGPGVTVYLGGNHSTQRITTYPFGHINQSIFPFNDKDHPFSKGSVIVGSDVWICENVTIMSGCKIGDGAIIANNSHIVNDVENYAIVGGNSVKFIKYRFKKEQIENLLKIKWWNFSNAKISENLHLLCSTNIDEFIEKNLPEEFKK